jgi:hypothetical protein
VREYLCANDFPQPRTGQTYGFAASTKVIAAVGEAESMRTDGWADR